MAERKRAREVLAVPRFLRSKRRLPASIQEMVDDQVRKVLEDPLLGEPKTGALRGVSVIKFKLGPHQYLLAYEFSPKLNQITLLDVGVHENFYRDLQKYRDSR
ncbi:MAG: type II toxin-antitoxin system RelE/ParE family toxin [Deltaproteobacteria bacterium]|nr:type II toxin-antitoxin system RelE/ParE family toxin [Deltaproteobacteria bacterium]